jgi:hypothetical protein
MNSALALTDRNTIEVLHSSLKTVVVVVMPGAWRVSGSGVT